MKEDEVYTAALLHDIGRMGLMAAYPIEYSSVLEFSGAESFNLLDCERELFDVDHCQAGAWLAEAWKLPAQFKHIAAHHHDEVPAGSSDLLAVVTLGCQLATALDFGVMAGRASPTFDEIRARLPKAAQARFGPNPGVLKKKVQDAAEGSEIALSCMNLDRCDNRNTMPVVTVSSKFQVVIPREIRESLAIRPGEKIAVFQIDDRIEFVRVKPIKQMRGFAKGIDTTVEREPDRP